MTSASEVLVGSFGDGTEAITTGSAPGRITLVGEHIDYVGGTVVAAAIDLGIEVAVRRSLDGIYRVASAGRLVTRVDPLPAGDFADRILAAGVVMDNQGFGLGPLEYGVFATLPEGAGLSSSAAVVCAALVAQLRRLNASVSGSDLVSLALAAERDVVGVPCGILDQSTVVLAPERGVAVIDCALPEVRRAPWPWTDLAIVACLTPQTHDVGGDGYRRCRRDAERVLKRLDAATVNDIGVDDLAKLPRSLARAGRHLVSESSRSRDAIAALEAGDREALGALLTASHASLRDDLRVSTPALDAAVNAALAAGAYGARLVGAGFGGSAIAVVDADRAQAAREAMAGACGVDAETSTWLLRTGGGVVVLHPDVVTLGSDD